VTQTISALADSIGVSTDTVRYYERLGLLPPTERNASGYRIYGEDIADRLQFIKDAQYMGLRLADIRELLDVQDQGQCPCGPTVDLVDMRLAEVDEKLRQLGALRQRLVDLKRQNAACMNGT
jgi:DNA-binding transcriptional MerR regulator